MRKKSFLVSVAAIGLMTLSFGVPRLHGEIPPRLALGRTAPAIGGTRPGRQRSDSSRMSPDVCSNLALKAAIAKARLEMKQIDPMLPSDPDALGSAMNSDRGLSEKIQRTFGNSDVIKSEFSPRGECVVTVKLPLERLQRLARDL